MHLKVADLERALAADFALIRARVADRFGNLRFYRTARNFSPIMATAAIEKPTTGPPGVAADPGEADRLLKRGFPDTDYTASRIKLVVPGHQCVLAASALKFEADGTARLTDADEVQPRTY